MSDRYWKVASAKSSPLSRSRRFPKRNRRACVVGSDGSLEMDLTDSVSMRLNIRILFDKEVDHPSGGTLRKRAENHRVQTTNAFIVRVRRVIATSEGGGVA